MTIEISAFGGLRVRRDGVEIDIGGRLAADTLALLVVAEGRPVNGEVLAERLWRGDPPPTARTTLQGYVSRLRRALEPGRSAQQAEVLVTRGDGYAFVLDRSAVDVHRFADRVADGRRLADAGELEAAADTVEDALSTWIGTPYAGIADVVDVAPQVARLEELRVLAIEERAAALLALGRGAAHVPELTALAAEHPLRERLHVLLATAMYAGGRQAEALDVLRAFRSRLLDELGLDPSPELQATETAVLNQTVEVPSRASVVASPAPLIGPAHELVGRDRELATMSEAWDRARSGRGSSVVITGEPGIGKTTLAESFAQGVGAELRWGRCLQTAGVPPYWPWQQLLGGLPDTSGASDEGARFAVGVEIARTLGASPGPLIAVLDDLQWADPDSLHVLQIVIDLLRDLPVLLVLTCRDEGLADPAIGTVVAAASRGPDGQRLALGPLTGDEVERLVGEIPGDDAVLEVTEVVRRSGGNPLFATELARLQASEADVPALARDVVRLRVDALPPLARDLIALVSVAGRDVPIGLAASAMDEAVEAVGDALRTATSAGLLDDDAGRARLRHDLVGEAVLSDLGSGHRARLHGRLADALESSPGAATSRAAIAVHRSEAAAGGADTRAATDCLVAAEEALERASDADAADLAARGLTHVPPSERTLRADLLHVRGTALRRLGRFEDATTALREEAALARDVGDPVRLASAALTSAGGGIGGYWASVVAPGVVDVALLEEALSADSLEPGLRSDLLAALAVHDASVGKDAVHLADEAERTAATVRSAVAGFVTRWTPRLAGERLDRARAMVQLSRGDPVAEATALHFLRTALVENLHAEEAAAASARFTDLADRRGDGDLILLDLWTRVGTSLAEGAYDTARELVNHAVATVDAASPAAAEVVRVSSQSTEGIIAWHERRLGDVIPAAVDLATTIDPDWLAVVALGHAQAGRRDACLQAADRLLAQGSGGVREPVHTVLLADAYVELGDEERAASVLPALESYGDTIVVLWAGMTFLGPAAYYRGAVKAVLGRPDAKDELARAAELSERFGYQPFRERAERMLDALWPRTSGSPVLHQRGPRGSSSYERHPVEEP